MSKQKMEQLQMGCSLNSVLLTVVNARYLDLMVGQLPTRHQSENQSSVVPRDYNPPSGKMTSCRSRGKMLLFIAMFHYFFGLVKVILFHLQAVENVLLFRQDQEVSSVSYHIRTRCRVLLHAAATAGTSCLRCNCWAYLRANVFVSVGVKMALYDVLQ